jgi:hypothetical protein
MENSQRNIWTKRQTQNTVIFTLKLAVSHPKGLVSLLDLDVRVTIGQLLDVRIHRDCLLNTF